MACVFLICVILHFLICVFLLLFQTPENIFQKIFCNATKHHENIFLFWKTFYSNQTQPYSLFFSLVQPNGGNDIPSLLFSFFLFPSLICKHSIRASINHIGSTTLYYKMMNMSLTFFRNYKYSNIGIFSLLIRVQR